MPTPLRCDPQLFSQDLSNQVMIVTGANSGCGLETAKQLVKLQATVVLACRNAEKGQAAAKEVGGVFVAPMDLGSLKSIREYVLVNNAGIMGVPYGKTKDGFEMHIGCNHLGHFLLTQLLTPLLLKTADATGKPSRLICLSSVAAAETSMSNVTANVDLDDLHWETREYNPGRAYGDSKLANYYHALEASQKYPADKLLATSVHPGWVQSNLDAHMAKRLFGEGWLGKTMANMVRQFFMWKGDTITVQDGAQTTLYCVLEDADKLESGKFYSQFGIYKDKQYQAGGWPMDLPNPHATPEKAAQLWELSERLVAEK